MSAAISLSACFPACSILAAFSRAAASYDAVAGLQRTVGDRLLEQLPANLVPRRWLDLGCGTGHFSRALAARYPQAEGLALDLAEGMLQQARPAGGAQGWIAADAESLPLRDGCVDLIYSSLVLQWCADFPRVLAEARTAATRGADWDAVGDEVGMTHRWVADFAKELGIAPDFDRLEPVSGRYVSVRLVGTTPNRCLVQVELEATKAREFARTRNIMDHPIHYREVFCCERINLPTDVHLEWVAAPNEVKY